MLSSPILFDLTKLFAFPWRLVYVWSITDEMLSRYKATEETEYLIKQEFNLEECHSYPGKLFPAILAAFRLVSNGFYLKK